MEQPKLVFDEAHLLFTDAPQACDQDRAGGPPGPIQGVYFVTQNPLDIPDTVLGSWATASARAARLHAARPEGRQDRGADHAPESRAGYRGRHHRTGRRRGPGVLAGRQGRPQPTERAWIVPPASRIGPATDAERQALRRANPLSASTSRRLTANPPMRCWRAGHRPPGQNGGAAAPSAGGGHAGWRGGRLHAGPERSAVRIDGPRGGKRDGVVQTMAKSTVRTVARELARGILGSLLGSKGRR